MKLPRFLTLVALGICASGLVGCAHMSASNSDTVQPLGQRRPDSSQSPTYYGQNYQRQVDANSRVGEHTK